MVSYVASLGNTGKRELEMSRYSIRTRHIINLQVLDWCDGIQYLSARYYLVSSMYLCIGCSSSFA